MVATVVVPLDGSVFAEEAIAPAVLLARTSHVRLLLIRVHDPPRPGPQCGQTWDELFRTEEEAYLEHVTARAQAELTPEVDWAVLDGPVATAICARAAANPGSIIVMSTHGRTGLRRVWLGSVADGVLRRTLAPVLMVRPSPDDRSESIGIGEPKFENILVALDGSQLAESVIPHAMAVASALAARVLFFRVFEPFFLHSPTHARQSVHVRNSSSTPTSSRQSARGYLEDLAMRCTVQFPSVEIHVETEDGAHPGSIVLERANRLSHPVIALASHGRGLSRLFLGSVADNVLRGDPRAVLVCRCPITHTKNPDV
jgi:nucleotide-binding universal stress UspA family protein